MTGVSHTTVLRLCRRFNETGGLSDHAKSGRPRTLSARQERQISRSIRFGQISTAVDAFNQIDSENGAIFSVQTVRRALKNQGLYSYVKKRKPLLTKIHRKRRYAFAQKHQNWTMDDWRRVLWTDESKFNLFGSDGKQYG